jgi:hypothetical protein
MNDDTFWGPQEEIAARYQDEPDSGDKEYWCECDVCKKQFVGYKKDRFCEECLCIEGYDK